MKVIFCIPSYSNSLSSPTDISLIRTRKLLDALPIEHDTLKYNKSCYISSARNHLVADFLKTDGTDLFFIDDDVSFPEKAVVDILLRPEAIVGGIYPLKKDQEDYPVVVKTNEAGIPLVENGLIEAVGLPTGFLRIKRGVFNFLMEKYPGLEYEEDGNTYYDLFGCMVLNKRWYGDDFAFCKRVELAGGRMWVMPDINFGHHGFKEYTGNYDKYLRNLKKEQDALLPSV